MQVEDTALEELIASLLRDTQLGNHAARLKSVSKLLAGLLLTQEAGLSGMARGSVLLNEEEQFRAKLKQAYYLISSQHFEAWEVSKALYDQLTQGLSPVLIAVDWTQVGRFMVLEASLVVEGRAIGFYSRSLLKEDLKDRQRVIEQSMEYALESFRQEGQHLHLVVDRGFAAMDYLGPSSLYPFVHRISRLKSPMILNWDGLEAPLGEWPLYEGEIVTIENAILGRKHKVACSIVLVHLPDACYLACDPFSLEVDCRSYQKRVWVEEQNRDLKSLFGVKKMRFLNAVRLDRMWALLGVAFAIIYTQAQSIAPMLDRLSRKYKDGRKELSWVSLVKYVNRLLPFVPDIKPLSIQ